MSRYLHRFTTEAEFQEYRENNYYEPWVSYTNNVDRVNYNKSEREKLLKTPLTTIAKENGTISFNIWKSMGTDMITSVSYSTDGGETWTTTNNTNNKSEHLVITVSVNEGDRVMWKANAQQNGYYYDDYDDYVGSFFSSTCEFDVEGNVMSMINDATGLTYNAQLCCLFADYDGENECLVADASKLILPATTLTDSCYNQMFRDCNSLTQAPELPATTLASGCYSSMFYGCTSLTTAPVLSATTLTQRCYFQMFRGCTSLTTAPELPTTTLADNCYAAMFRGCTSLTHAPVLSATTLTNYCYYYMFEGCTSLTTAPELPATTLVSNCYRRMFENCSNLNYIKCLATNISASNCTSNWVNGVQTTSGTFIKNSNIPVGTGGWTTGINGVPTNWTVQDAS